MNRNMANTSVEDNAVKSVGPFRDLTSDRSFDFVFDEVAVVEPEVANYGDTAIYGEPFQPESR